MRMGRATDKGDEFLPPHGTPKAKDHDLTITPRIAARSGHDGKRPLAAFHGSTPLIALRCVAQDMQTRRSKLFDRTTEKFRTCRMMPGQWSPHGVPAAL